MRRESLSLNWIWKKTVEKGLLHLNVRVLFINIWMDTGSGQACQPALIQTVTHLITSSELDKRKSENICTCFGGILFIIIIIIIGWMNWWLIGWIDDGAKISPFHFYLLFTNISFSLNLKVIQSLPSHALKLASLTFLLPPYMGTRPGGMA